LFFADKRSQRNTRAVGVSRPWQTNTTALALAIPTAG
jgi:hypothetical protein